jgi:hypothetical protein
MIRSRLEGDLRAMPANVRDSTLAEVARALADVLDQGCGARDAASVAKEMRACLADLRERAEAVPDEGDPIDGLAQRRNARIAGTNLPGGAGRAS